MIHARASVYLEHNANIPRGVDEFSERTTALFEGAREKVAKLINAPQTREVIFCRNAIMYRVPDLMKLVVERLAMALAPGGFLFLGHAESLRGLSHDFHLRHTHDTFYYQKRQVAETPAVSARRTSSTAPAATIASTRRSMRMYGTSRSHVSPTSVVAWRVSSVHSRWGPVGRTSAPRAGGAGQRTAGGGRAS